MSFQRMATYYAQSGHTFRQSASSSWCSTLNDSSKFVFPSRRKQENDNLQQVRSYHATSRQEILPLIGVAAVVMIGRYSWKALQRMDDEWEEYQWQLEQ